MSEYVGTLLANPTVKKLAYFLIAILLIAIIRYFAQIFVRRYMEDSESQFLTIKWIANASYLISLLVLLAIFSGQLGGLAVFLGAIGVGITFALQEVIASFAGWLAVIIGNFYRSGDRVQLGGIKGDVIDISVLRTTLMEVGEWLDADVHTGRMVRIANSFVFKEPVFNYTANFPFLWDELKIPIRHGSDYVLTRELMQKAAYTISEPTIVEAARSWQEVKRAYFIDEVRLEPQVTMIITDNCLEFTVNYIVNHRNRRVVRDQLFTRILEEFNLYPDKISIASATIALVETPPIHVTFDKSPAE